MKYTIIYIDKFYQKVKYTELLMRLIDDTKAVSMVVAALLLIIVVAGSVAFLAGTMQGVTSQTDKAVSNGNSADLGAIKINIISSDLALPAVSPLVKAYNDKTLGVKLQLQQSDSLGGTSNFSIGSVSSGLADIGVSDREPSPDEMAKYPDLVAQKFGISGIVVIVNSSTPNIIFSKSDLINNYSGSCFTCFKAYHMQNMSSRYTGTEAAFLQYINASINSPYSVKGGASMLDAVKNMPESIGFIEYGYVDSQDKLGNNVYIGGLKNENSSITYTNMSYSNFTLAAISDNVNNSYYPLELAHPLYFVTRGKSSLADAFVKWARSFEGQDIIEKNGYISYTREFS
jgi:ABC-type phosphate transport system substrate-binding protein